MTVKLATEFVSPQERGLPQECVACRNQQPDLAHIDFDAEADRGWYGDDPSTQITLENVIICATCVKEGAHLLGMSDEGAKDDRIADLERKLAEMERRHKEAQTYADKLEEALPHRPVPMRGMSEENRRAQSERMKRMHAEGKLKREVANA
jgi:hypothetical protein